MKGSLGCQLNLDIGMTNITSAYLIDDILCPCCELLIVFESAGKIIFTNDDRCYITYKGIDWIPSSFKQSLTPSGIWHCEGAFNPKQSNQLITKPLKNTRELANELNLAFPKGSKSLPIKFPIINYRSGKLIQEYIHQSFQDCYTKQDMNNAQFMYINGVNFYSDTLNNIVNQTSEVMIDDGTSIVEVINEEIRIDLITARGAEHWSRTDYIKKMMGVKVQMKTTQPAIFMHSYVLDFPELEDLGIDKKMVCVRSECNLLDMVGFTHIFSELKYL